MAGSAPASALFLFLLLVSGSAATAPGKRRFVFYFSDVLWHLCDGENVNRTILAGEDHLGDMVPFDGQRDIFTAWLGFSFVFNHKNHTGGSFGFFAADPLMGKANGISVIGRGRAILMISSFQGKLYFRLHIELNLYESW